MESFAHHCGTTRFGKWVFAIARRKYLSHKKKYNNLRHKSIANETLKNVTERVFKRIKFILK